MVLCPQCGKENPDEHEACRECGAVLPESPVMEQSLGTSLGFDSQDVETVVPPEVLLKKFKAIVELRKTPERLRFRRNAIILSVIPSVVVLLMLAFWSPEYSVAIDDWIPFEGEGLSFYDVASMEGNALILPMIVLCAVAAVSGILSPMCSTVGPIILICLIIISDSFTVYSGGHSLQYSCVGPMWYAGILIGVLCTVTAYISACFMSRSLSPDGRVRDRSTGVFHLGLLYNVDRNWNRVARRRFPVCR